MAPPVLASVLTVTLPAPALKEIKGVALKVIVLAVDSKVTAPLPLLKFMMPDALFVMAPEAIKLQAPGEE